MKLIKEKKIYTGDGVIENGYIRFDAVSYTHLHIRIRKIWINSESWLEGRKVKKILFDF